MTWEYIMQVLPNYFLSSFKCMVGLITYQYHEIQKMLIGIASLLLFKSYDPIFHCASSFYALFLALPFGYFGGRWKMSTESFLSITLTEGLGSKAGISVMTKVSGVLTSLSRCLWSPTVTVIQVRIYAHEKWKWKMFIFKHTGVFT